LVDALAGDDAEGASVRDRIAEIAEGNPLYAEQLLSYVSEGAALDSVPATLELLLASRLERLPAAERRLLQCAAVIGRAFGRSLLAAVEPPAVESELDAGLTSLVQRGLLHPDGDGGLRFHHVLLRDVAYASLPKTERAELHERVADRLTGATNELVGYHLE